MMNSLLKETKTCQVCKKTFSSGNALGGHMKSHSRELSTKASSAGSITPSSLRPCNDLGANFKPHETVLMRSVVQTSEVVDGRIPDLNIDVQTSEEVDDGRIPDLNIDVQPSEEEVGGQTPDLNKEGEQQITADGKRKIDIDLEEVTSTESPYCLTVEETALCLLQMKGDMRSEDSQNPPKPIDTSVSTRKRKDNVDYIEIESEEDHEDSDDEEYVVEDDQDNEDGDVKIPTSEVEDQTAAESDEDERMGKKKQTKYICDKCGKVLSSYQALGGHRSSHRNKRLKISEKDEPVVRRRQYECQICERVFKSGQALGGHKKAHLMFLKPTNLTTFRQVP